MYKSQQWRSNNWENPFTKEHMNLSPDADIESSIYESGADAMLRALYKLAKESLTGLFYIDSKAQNIYEVK